MMNVSMNRVRGFGWAIVVLMLLWDDCKCLCRRCCRWIYDRMNGRHNDGGGKVSNYGRGFLSRDRMRCWR